jgi:hypothetical protein
MNFAFHEIEAPSAAAAYRDARADGGQRDVTLTSLQVTIGRRLRGIQMKIRVPVKAYSGVTLGLEQASGGRPFYKVSLPHPDKELAILLVETFDEVEAHTLWRGWAKHLSLPMMVERDDGALEHFADAPREMRSFERGGGTSPTLRSRGRFVRRRRMGELRADAMIHCDEREIISYE